MQLIYPPVCLCVCQKNGGREEEKKSVVFFSAPVKINVTVNLPDEIPRNQCLCVARNPVHLSSVATKLKHPLPEDPRQLERVRRERKVQTIVPFFLFTKNARLRGAFLETLAVKELFFPNIYVIPLARGQREPLLKWNLDSLAVGENKRRENLQTDWLCVCSSILTTGWTRIL